MFLKFYLEFQRTRWMYRLQSKTFKSGIFHELITCRINVGMWSEFKHIKENGKKTNQILLHTTSKEFIY